MRLGAHRVTEMPPRGGHLLADRGPEAHNLPVLPLIDLLILLGWTSLLVGFVLKALSIALSYPLSIFGLAPIDFLLVAGVSLLFALSLAARTWVKVHEPRLVARRRVAEYGVNQGEGGSPQRSETDRPISDRPAGSRAGVPRPPETATGH
jgi:hypothetical protein